jgi:CDP-6-deoxy-D-xylo-4-hexulose-3-dehydrase
MNSVFWIGVFPGLTGEMLDFVVKTIFDFVENSRSRQLVQVDAKNCLSGS